MTPDERRHVETLERRLYLYAQVIDRTTHEFQPVPAAPDWCQRCPPNLPPPHPPHPTSPGGVMSLHESEVEVRRAVRVLTHYLADGAEIGARLYAAYVAHTTGEPQPAAEGFTAPDPTGMWARARAIDAARRRDVSLALAEHTEQAIRVVGGWVPDRGGAT